MAKEKTLSDFRMRSVQLKQQYLDEKIKYGWEYTIIEEDHEDFHIFFVANVHKTTKLLFSEEMKTLIEKDIHSMDIRVINKMLKVLEGEE